MTPKPLGSTTDHQRPSLWHSWWRCSTPTCSYRSCPAISSSARSTTTFTFPVVTPRILDEIERTLQTDFAHVDRAALRRRAGQVRTALAFHTHPDPKATDAVARVNRKDRHVAAVAVAVKADVVASNDRRLRHQLQALDPPIAALTADELALRLLDQDCDGVSDVLDTMVAKRTRRPVTRHELIGELAGPLPRFAAKLRDPPDVRS